jgi:sec-independent protein translocase protein TatA
MFGMGPWEIGLILLVVLLLFGAKRLPEIAKNMGQGIKEFKKSVKDTQDEIKSAVDTKPDNNNDANKKDQ